MRPSGLLTVGLCMTLFLALFAFSAPMGTSRADPASQVDYPLHARAHAYGPLEVETTSEPSAPPALVHTRELSNTTGERGHFVTSSKVGPYGTQGFHFYSPLVRQAGFDVNQSYFLYDGADNESVFLSFKYLNTLGSKDIIGRRPRNVSVTHIIGNDTQEWTTTADTWGAVRYRDLWAGGIDLRYVAVAGENLINGFKSDFILTDPSADPADIAVEVSGAESLVVSADGQELTIVTELGNITQEVYMYEMATEEQVFGNFTADGSVFGFEVGGSWTRLVIDPLIYSTFLAGTGNDDAYGVSVDDVGDAYVVGTTTSADFPTTPGAYNTTYGGSEDVFVCKLAANGSTLIYSTFVGGSGGDFGRDITIDAEGNAYVLAGQNSADFPTTVGAFAEQDDPADQGNLAVFCLAANGSTMLWSGVASGNDWDLPYAIVLDPVHSDVVIVGATESSDFPTTVGAYDTTHNGQMDGFITRISADGSSWSNCTFVGSLVYDIIRGVGVNSTGYVYFGGHTSSNLFPAVGNAYDMTSNGGNDLVYGILSWDLTALHVSGYLGGSGNEQGGAIAMLDDRVAITGWTQSGNYPTTPDTYNDTYGGNNDVVVSILNARLSTLNYSTYVGGSAKDEPGDAGGTIAMDDNGLIWVTGYTESTDFPIVSCGVQNTTGGARDVFLVAFPADLSNLAYSTYLGGSDNDYGRACATKDVPGDAWSRDVFVVGLTASNDFPTTTGSFEESFTAGNDAFAVCLYSPLPQPLVNNITHYSPVELYADWTLYSKVTCVGNVSQVKLHFNDTYYDMNNTGLEYYNYTITIRTTNPGTNTYTIWANGTAGNTTETTSHTFAVGNIPQFSGFSGASTVATVTDWQTSVRVTDSTSGDSGVASVWIQFDGDEDGWREMKADGDVYTSPVYVFEDEGDELWQVRAYDNVGNVAYSSKTRLTVGGEASIASTSSTLTVTIEEDPWVPTPVSSASWWIYVAVFATLILGFALTAAPRVPNGELIMTLLVAAGASAMVMAYLSAVVGVLDPTTMAIVWLGLLAWAWATSRGGPTGLLLGGAVLCIGLAVQALLAGAILEWLTWAYVLGAAASASGALSIETGNAYLILATVILSITAVVFGIIFIFV